MTKYAAIQIGDKAELRHTVSQQDIDRFVALTGDDNKLHVDPTYARLTSFKQPVVHGMLEAAFISTLIGTKLPGDGALWCSQKLDFLLPARIGDELIVRAMVTKKVDRLQTIEMEVEVLNQNKRKLTTGSVTVKIVEPEIKLLRNVPASTPKTAVVLGATGGIGAAVALQLARDGFDIMLHYGSNHSRALELEHQIKDIGRDAACVQADFLKVADLRALADVTKRKFPFIGALVNCAAARITQIRFLDMEWADMEAAWNANLKSAFHILQAFVPIMVQQGYGRIVHISTQAVDTPNPEWLAYITSKSALEGFSKALAIELAPKGVLLNLVSPGMTDTDLIADVPEKARLVAAAKTPLRRIARPEDVAGVISFLVSEKADYLVGETIRINGGQLML